MSNFEDDIEQYIDQCGLVQNSPGGERGNGLLFTAEAILLMVKLGALNEQLFKRFNDGYTACQAQEGLLSRTPPGVAFNQDQEGPDDYVGACAASYFLKNDVAAKILRYGRAWRPIPYVYNNVNPGKFTFPSWLGRQQNLVCHMQFAAGETPPLWRKIWWCLAILQSAWAKKEDLDSKTLAWLCIATMDGRSWLCQKVADYWWKKLLDVFPDGMHGVFVDYFGEGHPIAKWCGTGK